jgi:hypothetical protein
MNPADVQSVGGVLHEIGALPAFGAARTQQCRRHAAAEVRTLSPPRRHSRLRLCVVRYSVTARDALAALPERAARVSASLQRPNAGSGSRCRRTARSDGTAGSDCRETQPFGEESERLGHRGGADLAGVTVDVSPYLLATGLRAVDHR